ncbi:RNA-directed DNA polymerase, eukaryota [Tanacetum coccineum]
MAINRFVVLALMFVAMVAYVSAADSAAGAAGDAASNAASDAAGAIAGAPAGAPDSGAAAGAPDAAGAGGATSGAAPAEGGAPSYKAIGVGSVLSALVVAGLFSFSMGDYGWTEVSRKKKGSVFQRLKFPQPKVSLADDLVKISLFVYKNNIGTDRSLYVRFIKVTNSRTLIESLSNVWIGKLRLHANVAKFDRNASSNPTHDGERVGNDPQPNMTFANGVKNLDSSKSSFASVLNAGKNSKTEVDTTPAIVLDEECILERDFSGSLMGKIKDINALSNLYVILANEGFDNVKLSYLGGLWVLLDAGSSISKEKLSKHVGVTSWFSELLPACNSFVSDDRLVWVSVEGLPSNTWTNTTFAKIVSSWGVLSDVDVVNDNALPFKKLCVLTKNHTIINDRIKVIVKGRVYWIRVKELDAWSLDFNHEFSDSSSLEEEYVDEEAGHVSDTYEYVKEKEVDHVSESSYMNDNGEEIKNHGIRNELSPNSKDPFGIYELLNRHKEMQNSKGDDPTFPQYKDVSTSAKGESTQTLKLKTGGSILEVMENLVEVGRTMGTWTSTSTKLLIVYVYAPQDLSERKSLWDYIHHMIDQWVGETGLVDLPLEGYSFTWSLKSAAKMSKLDRFLVSEGLLSVFPSLSALCLDMHLSDHRPILMRDMVVDYRPTPFRVFHSWFTKDGYSIQNRISELDSLMDKGMANEDLVKERTSLTKDLQDINDRHLLDMAQKAKIRWAIEESQMFRRVSFEQNVDLESNVTYDEIRKAVWDCGTNKTPGPDGFTFDFIRKYWKIIDRDVVNAVQEFFASSHFPPGTNSLFITLIPKKQDSKVVKDYRPISLIGSIYKIIAKIMANRLSFVISDLISDVQSAFVSNRQILDGPFILNELISWCKYNKTKAMIFKVDFEKAFDSVRWDFLDDILDKFGFGTKWRGWIQGCLSSAMGSILVNGSPTSEFKFHKGLKQGDPLSPFLFILVMESLHLSFNNVLNAGLFKGIRINSSLTLSHLFYADDAVFIGKWDKANFTDIVQVLKCFFLASGLKINIHKSKLMGIGIAQEEVSVAANLIGCTTFTTPFNYLGVKVGTAISRSCSWEDVLSKISARLSKWKIKTLSIGGRLTLIKSVLTSLPLYHMSIYKVPKGVLNRMEAIRWRFFYGQDNNEKKLSMIGWQKILASKKKGGLGVSTIYGDHGSLDNPGSVSRSSLWCTIICEIGNLSLKGTNLLSHMKKKVVNGIHTYFWGDPWLYDMSLLQVFPRLYALECNKQVSVAVKLSEGSLTDSFRREPRGGIEEEQLLLLSNKLTTVTLANSNDRWIWLLDSSGEFLVKSVRSYIDDTLLPTVGFPTRWVKVVPIKINVFAWKVCLDKLPTRLNLSLRGIDIPSIICPICSSAGESCSHLLFACNMARLLLRKVARWWDLQTPDLNSYDDWLSWFISIRLSKGLKEVLEGVFYVMWWAIWKFRNEVLFGTSPPRLDLIFDDIVLLSFRWCSSRCKNKFDWISWLKCPRSLSL